MRSKTHIFRGCFFRGFSRVVSWCENSNFQTLKYNSKNCCFI